MISVLNHLLQLNGNRMRILILLVSMFFIYSCSSSKTVTRTPVDLKPTTAKEDKRINRTKGDVDTIYWTEIDRTKDYNQRIEDIDLEKKDRYKISLLIPFEISGNKPSDIEAPETKLGRMTHYYAGVKLALQQLEEEGINLDIEVFDAESGNFNNKLQSCRNSDVIIGPRNKEQLEIVANYGKSNEIPVISPWLSSRSLAKENPYYIQLIPSVRDHYARIVEHVTENYSPDQVILLGRNIRKDRSLIHYIQTVAAVVQQNSETKVFEEFYVDVDSLKEGVEAFDKKFFTDKTTVFILPNYSFTEDESFVYNCVRKLSGEKGLEDVVLYGMPLLLESDKIKFELYNNLNMRICRSNYVDKSDPTVIEFRELYYNNYYDFPSEEAYKAYDMMLFVGRNIYDYGKKFHYFLDRYESSLMQTKFDIQKVYKDPESEDFEHIQYLQNKHLYILSFDNYRFSKL